MKKRFPILLISAAWPLAALAQTAPEGQMLAPSVDTAIVATAEAAPEVPPEVKSIQDRWAVIKYQTPESEQEKAITELATEAHQVTQTLQGQPEAKLWEAIVLSTKAGIAGGMDALDDIRASKNLLEEVIAVKPDTMNGSAYTSLGTLYYKAPVWPVSFGDNEKAKANLEQARALNPDGIDPNFFYGEFLLGTNHAKEAIPVLELALVAAPRPGREVADAGRRAEITALLTKARKEAAY